MVALFALVVFARPDGSPIMAECLDAVPRGRPRNVSLPGRGFAVAVLDLGYAVATSRGPVAVDPCSFEIIARCDDSGEADRLRVRDGSSVDYRRRDGTVAGCDLDRGMRIAPAADAAEALDGPPQVRTADAVASIRDGVVHLAPRGERLRRLELATDALSIAFDADGSTLAVGDRAGMVTLFTVPGGLPRYSYRAHALNTYGVAFDHGRRRVLTVSGDTLLTLRRWP